MAGVDEQEQALVERAAEMAAEAEANPAGRCIEGEAVFWLAADHAVRPGHIYSEAGRAEFKISGSCEYHFDKWFAEPEEGDEGDA